MTARQKGGPVFPFDRPRRDGQLIRELMCRRCAAWMAWDGTTWRHVDGTEACVDPEAVWDPKESPAQD